MAVNTNINIPYSPFLDNLTGRPAREWMIWLMNPQVASINLANAIGPSSGGTGTTVIPQNGQTLIGNGTTYTVAYLTPDLGIGITNGAGSIKIKNTGVLSNAAGTGISVSAATGNVTIANTGVISVTGTSPVVSSGGQNPAISMPSASATTSGYLTSTDWNTFNNKSSNSAPVTISTSTYTVATTDIWLINNYAGTLTLTLPTASSYSGRVLNVQNYQAFTVVSASSNVVPIAGGSAGTSILLASAGDRCTLVSNGTNWLVTDYTPNNILLLE
jgi:hypothetical protein